LITSCKQKNKIVNSKNLNIELYDIWIKSYLLFRIMVKGVSGNADCAFEQTLFRENIQIFKDSDGILFLYK
jgi:hypothetical protein